MGVEHRTQTICVVRVALLHRLERREAGEHVFVKSGVVLADAAEDVLSTQKFARRSSLSRRVRNIRRGASENDIEELAVGAKLLEEEQADVDVLGVLGAYRGVGYGGSRLAIAEQLEALRQHYT
jgi:hypothetical protein